MCRTRQEIINDEPDVQKLISLKKRLEDGDINGFSVDRLLFEIPKLEVQIESTIREFKLIDTQEDCDASIIKLAEEAKEGWSKHYEFHKKNPSLVALFKKSPTGMVSFGGAGLIASSLFYVKETRDVIFSLAGLKDIAGQDILNYGFPLFLFFLITGIITFANARDKKEESD